jgi:thiol:disulfide interchange protein
MTGKNVRIIIGVILLALAAWLYWGAGMSWTAVVALIFAVIAFIGAFAGGKKDETPPTTGGAEGGEPKIE